jgi:hypothetical protein
MKRRTQVGSDDFVPTTPLGPIQGLIGGFQQSVTAIHAFLQGSSYADAHCDSKGLASPGCFSTAVLIFSETLMAIDFLVSGTRIPNSSPP